MPIEFQTRVADFKNATKQLLVNRGKFKKTDIADLLVSRAATWSITTPWRSRK